MYLDCRETEFKNIDLSNNTELETLDCQANKLESLDISRNTLLKSLICSENKLTKLDLSKNTKLEKAIINKNLFTSLDFSKNMALERLEVNENQLTNLDLDSNKELIYLSCSKNMLTFLDTEKNTNLIEFRCDDNKTEIEMSGNRYNMGELKGLDILRGSDWTNAELEGGTLFVENVENLVTYSYECGKDVTAKFTLIPLKSDMGDINSDGASDASDASMILAEYADISTGGTGDFSVKQKNTPM